MNQGCYEKEVGEALLRPAPKDSCVPDDFYATTNRRTQVYPGRRSGATWRTCAWTASSWKRGADLACRLIRDVKAGEKIVCTSRSVRVFPLFSEQESEEFGFMASDVSSERSVDVAISRVAEELARQKRDRGRVIVVAGPVVIHTGGGPALAALVRGGLRVRPPCRATPWPCTTWKAPCSAPRWASPWKREGPCSRDTATTSGPSTPCLRTARSRPRLKQGR